MISQVVYALTLLGVCQAKIVQDYVHPISISDKHFVDSVTGDRFLVKGVDYQPGGSSAYDGYHDPLSDQNICARDISAMQDLGINTMRVYTINPDLNHDKCMTMLAAANIYLLLDVNSPLIGQSINRYEPWTTYTPQYLKHVFKVVEQFSHYNNTLGFFIGNEIVNDERSASVSPPYIKAVTRDVKNYLKSQGLRQVPVGYSAADDLKFRKDLPHYLTCGKADSAIDFYGLNSYQWCGDQTMESSGYDILIQDNKQVPVPIVISEFGCNLVQPRTFQEVSAIFSPAMLDVFEGGLAYEFTEEENEYGLVKVQNDFSIKLTNDFTALKEKYNNVKNTIPLQGKSSPQSKDETHQCSPSYDNLPGATKQIPQSFGTEMIRNGVPVQKGKYDLSMTSTNGTMPSSSYHIVDMLGVYHWNPSIEVVNSLRRGIDVKWGKLRSMESTNDKQKKPKKAKNDDDENSNEKSTGKKNQTMPETKEQKTNDATSKKQFLNSVLLAGLYVVYMCVL